MKIFLSICLLFLMVLMEEVKPSPARQKPRLKQRVNVLEESMKKLEERVQALEDCKACSKITELNKMLIELKNKIDPTEPPKPDFMCPTCKGMGPNAEDECENNLENQVCNEDQLQCLAYKQGDELFMRSCVTESQFYEQLEHCKADPACGMGRCLESGCLANVYYI